jgi:trans-aconitate 2-methyltransferase
MSPWNPDLYLQFKAERTQPTVDLVARIAIDSPRTVVDLGCGPGNSTLVLRERWPDADVLGIDNSREMIEKARAAGPDGRWQLADIREWRPEEKCDVLFSGATLQWIPDHKQLMPRLFSFVRAGGAFAVQLPANQEAPLHNALLRISRRREWKRLVAGCEDLIVYQPPAFYYGILSALSPKVQLWETTYYHVLRGHQELIDWYSSTGMRTYLERLPEESQKELFRMRVLKECRGSYPVQTDGRILYPFNRLFFVVGKP